MMAPRSGNSIQTWDFEAYGKGPIKRDYGSFVLYSDHRAALDEAAEASRVLRVLQHDWFVRVSPQSDNSMWFTVEDDYGRRHYGTLDETERFLGLKVLDRLDTRTTST